MFQSYSFSHFLQGGILGALSSPTAPSFHIGPAFMSSPIASLNSLPPSFLHINISSTTSRFSLI